MMLGSIKDLVAQLRASHLLDTGQHTELTEQIGAYRSTQELIEDLVRRGWLTRYQADQINQGKIDSITIGDYVVLEQLGEGGMGLVYKVRHHRTKRIEVLKVIRQELKGVSKVARRFDREIEAASKLSHPNIVTAYGAGTAGEIDYFAMEYVDGMDLGQLVLKEGPLPVRDACDYIRQAALGLQHAHEYGLIHRDIKPDNLLLSRRDRVVKLLDLGLCRYQDQEAIDKNASKLTVSGTAVGTPEYMAPEQIRDSSNVDIRADLYGLGCTFYYLLAGRDAFAARTPMEVMYRQVSQEPPPLTKYRTDVPQAVIRILSKLMAKKREHRYQTPAELAHDLQYLLDHPHLLEPGAEPEPVTTIQPLLLATPTRNPASQPPTAPVSPLQSRTSAGVQAVVGAGIIAAVVFALALGAFLLWRG